MVDNIIVDKMVKICSGMPMRSFLGMLRYCGVDRPGDYLRLMLLDGRAELGKRWSIYVK